MGVKGGVPGAAHAVAKAHRAEPLSWLDQLATRSALHETGLLFEVADARGHSTVIGAQHLLARLLVAKRVEQRHRLGGGEADVVGEDRLLGALATRRVGEGASRQAMDELLAALRIAALEDRGVGRPVDLAQ